MPSVAVRVTWGEDVLCFRLLRPGQRFVVGPDAKSTDFVVPSEKRSVFVDRKGNVVLEYEDGYRLLEMPAKLDVQLGEGLKLSVRSARDASLRRSFAARSWLLDLALLAGVASYVLMVVVVSFFAFQSSLETRWEPTRRNERVSESFGVWSLGETTISAGTSPDWRPLLKVERPVGFAIFAEAPRARKDADGRTGGTGARAKLAEGPLGNPEEPEALGSWSLTERAVVRDPAPASERRWKLRRDGMYSHFGFQLEPVGHDGWDTESSDETIAAPFEEEELAGEEELDVVGNTFGPEPIDPAGAALGVRGVGPGGGGKKKGIGLGTRKKLGHGSGSRSAQGSALLKTSAFTRDVGLAVHRPKAPSFSTLVAPEDVERVLRQNAGRFAACGHSSSVGITFGVGADGAPRVISAPDRCVEAVVTQLRFPPSTNGSATVTRRVRLR